MKRRGATSDPKSAFRELMAAHEPALRRLTYAYAAQDADRDDLFQEIALALWRALPTFRADSSERTWMFRVAHNVAIRVAKRRRRVERPLEPATSELPALNEHDPAERLDLEAQCRRLADAVRQLPAADRSLVLLRLEGLTHEEIGRVTGISAGASATRLSRIRDRLDAAVMGRETSS